MCTCSLLQHIKMMLIVVCIYCVAIQIGLGPGDATAIRVGQALGANKPRRAALAARVGFFLVGQCASYTTIVY